MPNITHHQENRNQNHDEVSHWLEWLSRGQGMSVGKDVEKMNPLISDNYIEFLNLKPGKKLKGN